MHSFKVLTRRAALKKVHDETWYESIQYFITYIFAIIYNHYKKTKTNNVSPGLSVALIPTEDMNSDKYIVSFFA